MKKQERKCVCLFMFSDSKLNLKAMKISTRFYVYC